MKYIILQERAGDSVYYHAVLFPEEVIHKNIAKASRQLQNGNHAEVVSAGFFYVNNGRVRVEGRSESLQIDSRPEDANIIAKDFGFVQPQGDGVWVPADAEPKETKQEPETVTAKPHRNDPCHCGSGKKYKRCCLKKGN